MKPVVAALILVLVACANAFAGAGDVRPVVVEVYTSQGCNTCISANALAAKLAQRPGLLVLSLPVTYWDMFGWKDTLASDDNTRRQKAYAAALRHGGVYTPQMIIDGVKDVPASREDAVSYALELATMARDDGMVPDENIPAIAKKDGPPPAAVAIVAGMRVKAPARSAWSVGVHIAKHADTLRVSVERAPEAARRANIDATVWMFRIRSSASVKIGGGENNGQVATYRNVVTETKNMGRWRGDPLTLDIPKVAPGMPAFDGIAVIVQQGSYGRVMGATLLSNVPGCKPSPNPAMCV